MFSLGSEAVGIENNYFAEMWSGSEANSYLRLIDFLYHSILGSRVIKKEKKFGIRTSWRRMLSVWRHWLSCCWQQLRKNCLRNAGSHREREQPPYRQGSGSKVGLYLRLIDFLHHSILGSRVIKGRDWHLLKANVVRLEAPVVLLLVRLRPWLVGTNISNV